MLYEPVEQHTAGLREATVETNREFVKLCLSVIGRESPLVRAAQPAFQQGDDQGNMVAFLTRRLAAGGADMSLVSKAGGLKMIVNR